MTPTEQSQQPEPLAFHLFQLAATFIPALPLLADWVGAALGWHIFFLTDSRIQSVFATIALGVGGWPFVGSLLGRGKSPLRRAAHGLTLIFALGLYGRGMYLTYGIGAAGSHDVFQMQVTLLLVATVWRLSLALGRGKEVT